MTEKLDNLFKTDDGKQKISASTPQELVNSKRRIVGICNSLKTSSQEYKPEKTIASIQRYIDEPIKTERILYSEISNYIFSLDPNERGTFATNAEKLLSFSYSDSGCDSDCRKIIIKIYDHSQLALYQIENASKIVVAGIEDTKNNMQMELVKEIKGMEKEYITILGIFAAIVLAFVGGITFSSSVLQHMASVSIFRLLIVIDFLGVVLVNIVYLLMKFIFVINGHDTELFKIKSTNIFFAIVGILIIASWFVCKLFLKTP